MTSSRSLRGPYVLFGMGAVNERKSAETKRNERTLERSLSIVRAVALGRDLPPNNVLLCASRRDENTVVRTRRAQILCKRSLAMATLRLRSLLSIKLRWIARLCERRGGSYQEEYMLLWAII